MNIKAALTNPSSDVVTLSVEIEPEPGIDEYEVKVAWPDNCQPKEGAVTQMTLNKLASLRGDFSAQMSAANDCESDIHVIVTPKAGGLPIQAFRETLVRSSSQTGVKYTLKPRTRNVPTQPVAEPPKPQPYDQGWRVDVTIQAPLAKIGETVNTTVEFDPLPGLMEYEVEVTFPADLGGATEKRTVAYDPSGGPRVRHVFGPSKAAGNGGRQLVRATVTACGKRGSDLGGPGGFPRSIGRGEGAMYILAGRGEHEIAGALKDNFDDMVGNRLTGAVDSIAAQLRSTNTNGIRLARASDPFVASPSRQAFWNSIRRSTSRLGFADYQRFMDANFCPPGGPTPGNMQMPFSQVDTYLRLKAFTELFLLQNAGVLPQVAVNVTNNNTLTSRALPAGTVLNGILAARPYLQIVLQNNPDLMDAARLDDVCDRLRYPVLIELIWSYWHEESMLVQTMHALKERFQNRTRAVGRDPLAQLEMDPLRPLNNILWGYIQDEQHRIGVRQRAYEYLHHYGISLEGKAIGNLRPADTRKRFLQAFHTLLYQCVQYYRQADDTMVVANANNVLWALRDLHLLLAEGAHNQYGDLPWNARLEMLMEQWILSRPEIQDFLRARRMVPYPEAWMGAVDSMKTLQGWSGTNVIHFRDLGTFGERILLSVREGGVAQQGGWSVVVDPAEAAAFALIWRPEIEGYINAYRAVTGVDLTQDPGDPRYLAQRDAAPSVHLQRRLGSAAAI
jgi:hypothetical protein